MAQNSGADKPLRVLMLSWEYPPLVVGGLGRHVHALATSLAAAGHEVTVVTRHAAGAPLQEYADGVRIVRAPEDPPLFPLSTPTLLAWTMAFNHALTRAGLHAAATGTYDVIHAHDWLVAHTAVTLKDHLGIPLVATIHATEAGRHQGWLPEDMNKCIHSVEWWLGHEAEKVLVCSAYMRWEVTRLLELAPSKVEVIPNGVDGSVWQAATRAVTAARTRFAGIGPLIGYAGRLVYEKGVQDLVGALPELRRRHPGLRLVVAGDGPHRTELQAQAKSLRMQRAIHFTGFLGEGELPAVLAASNAVVVPSIYEPFGMVALEAASAGAPLAVASTGGLAEIVEQGVTGVTFPAKDSSALASAVSSLLVDETSARRMAKRARAMITHRYGWSTIAASTGRAYAAAMANGPAAQAALAAARLSGERTRIVVPDGNLLSTEPAAA